MVDLALLHLLPYMLVTDPAPLCPLPLFLAANLGHLHPLPPHFLVACLGPLPLPP